MSANAQAKGKLKDGDLYVVKTLLGSDPDCNRRSIYRWPSDKPLAVVNAEMQPWSEEHDRQLTEALRRLRDKTS